MKIGEEYGNMYNSWKAVCTYKVQFIPKAIILWGF